MEYIVKLLFITISILLLATLIIIYIRGFFRPHAYYRIRNFHQSRISDFISVLGGLSDSFTCSAQAKKIVVKAEAIFALRIREIRKAEEFIYFETFIMTPGDRADEFAIALAEKAAQGVRIKILVDDYGTKNISKKYWHRLKKSGVEVRFFNRFTWKDPFYYLIRNHRKLLIVDGKSALIGGAGISDLWDGQDGRKGKTPWYDYEISLKGSVVTRLQYIFWKHWLDADGDLDINEECLAHSNNIKETFSQEKHNFLISVGEDPTQRDSGIRSLFSFLIQSAKKQIWIASPYFLPDPNLQKLFLAAKSRGVDIHILTMGSHTDKPPVRFASRQLYVNLIRAGINIHEYQPSMMHAKAIFIDGEWISLGSANFDPRSLFRNDELNITTNDKVLVEYIHDFFEEGFSCSKQIDLNDLKQRGIQERIIGRLMILFFWQL